MVFSCSFSLSLSLPSICFYFQQFVHVHKNSIKTLTCHCAYYWCGWRLVHSTCVQLNSYHEHLCSFFFYFTYAASLSHDMPPPPSPWHTLSKHGSTSMPTWRDDVFYSIVSVFNFQNKLFPTNDCEGELTASFHGRRELYSILECLTLATTENKILLYIPLALSTHFFFLSFKMCYLMANLHNWNAEHHKKVHDSGSGCLGHECITRCLMRDKIASVTVKSKLEKKK